MGRTNAWPGERRNECLKRTSGSRRACPRACCGRVGGRETRLLAGFQKQSWRAYILNAWMYFVLVGNHGQVQGKAPCSNRHGPRYSPNRASMDLSYLACFQLFPPMRHDADSPPLVMPRMARFRISRIAGIHEYRLANSSRHPWVRSDWAIYWSLLPCSALGPAIFALQSVQTMPTLAVSPSSPPPILVTNNSPHSRPSSPSATKRTPPSARLKPGSSPLAPVFTSDTCRAADPVVLNYPQHHAASRPDQC